MNEKPSDGDGGYLKNGCLNEQGTNINTHMPPSHQERVIAQRDISSSLMALSLSAHFYFFRRHRGPEPMYVEKGEQW